MVLIMYSKVAIHRLNMRNYNISWSKGKRRGCSKRMKVGRVNRFQLRLTNTPLDLEHPHTPSFFLRPEVFFVIPFSNVHFISSVFLPQAISSHTPLAQYIHTHIHKKGKRGSQWWLLCLILSKFSKVFSCSRRIVVESVRGCRTIQPTL